MTAETKKRRGRPPKKKNSKKDLNDIPSDTFKVPCTLCGKKNEGKANEDWNVYVPSTEMANHISEVHSDEIVSKKIEEQKGPWIQELEKLEKKGISWTVILVPPNGTVTVDSSLIRRGNPNVFKLSWRAMIEEIYEQRRVIAPLD